jgi:hypothetical protein
MNRAPLTSLVVLLLGMGPLVSVAIAQSTVPSTEPGQFPPPLEITGDQDHQHMMDLLQISSLRPGVSNSGPTAADRPNYDEAKANNYHNLPDPLVLKDGQKVTTAQLWWKKRRPEIVEDFDREIYGRLPRDLPTVKWEVTQTLRDTCDGVAIVTRQLAGHVENSSYPPISVDILVSLTTPANAAAPVPVIMQFQGGRRANATTRPVTTPQATGPAVKPQATAPSWEHQVLSRGWGCAEFSATSVQADNAAGLTRGIIGLMNKGQQRTPEDWGALRAWAWGASQVLNYLETNPEVDAKRVGIEGHSRFGKAALVAMAYDPRFAICYVSSSGEGGSKLHRRNFGEKVENVAATGEYYWMAGNFMKYAGPLTPDDMPVDSHELIAMCAPRPVFLGSGLTAGDGWADARGTFLAGVGASPVYALLGKKGLEVKEMPEIGTSLVDGDIGFRQHPGGHTDMPNWPTFLSFAERYLVPQQ